MPTEWEDNLKESVLENMEQSHLMFINQLEMTQEMDTYTEVLDPKLKMAVSHIHLEEISHSYTNI